MWNNGGTSIKMWAKEVANLFFLSEKLGGLDGTTPNDWMTLESDDWLPLIERHYCATGRQRGTSQSGGMG